MQLLYVAFPNKLTITTAAAHMKFFGLQNNVNWDVIPYIIVPLLGLFYEVKKSRLIWRPRLPVSLAVRELVPAANPFVGGS
jgi:hypothetical protein